MGELFNGIQVARQRDNETYYHKVPVTYASKERFNLKLNKIISSNSESDIAKVETILPRIYITLNDIMYNAQMATSMSIRDTQGSTGSMSTRYNPVPYKLTFEMGIYTRHEDDMFQIIEQILPYFRPNFTVKITELHDSMTPIERDINITISSITPGEDLEGDISTRRQLQWLIIFELDGWIYPPSENLKGEIRTMYLDFRANEKELDATGVTFESSDYHQTEELDHSYSSDQPIPSGDIPPDVRENT
jgi:hypothetical protein